MRRPLLLVPVILALLLATGPAASAGEPPIRKAEFQLRADGFLVTLKTESSSEKVVLSLYRGGQVAIYEAPAEITADSVKVRFGRLGELDYTFTPAGGKRPKCKGADGTTEGTFKGTFDFTGENDYVTIEADHAHGSFEVFPVEGCKEPPSRTTPPTRARRTSPAGEGGGEGEHEVTLAATTGGKRRVDYLLAFTLPTKKGTGLFINGFRAERREGMLIERGVQVQARLGALRWDRATGIAHLDPPAPFRGSAEFRHRPHGRSIWRGSLRIPLLGGRPLRLTGGRFKASINSGSIIE